MQQLTEGSILQERYKIKQVLDRGAMGTIYLGVDSRLSDNKAIKEMNPTFLKEEEKNKFLELFKQEAHILSRLHHNNLPKVIDYFFENGRYYLVMDYINGRNLDDYVKYNPMDIKNVAKITYQICDVLTYLHNQKPHPIIFRDLKPSNIMIMDDLTVKLIDFGIVRIFKESKKCDTVIVGTPGFAPPEQYGKRQTDERSDIYSLGATLYYILSGKVPDIPDEKAKKEIYDNPVVPVNLKSIILKCMALQPEDRYKSIEEFKQAFKGSLENPVNIPEKSNPREMISSEKQEVNNITGTIYTFGFMFLPSGIFAILIYLARLILIPHLREDILAGLIPFIGLGAITAIWISIIKKLKKIPGFNWEALIFITLPVALLNGRNLFILGVPSYQSGGWELWHALLLLLIVLPVMCILSIILLTFFRHKKMEKAETSTVSVKSKESFIGKCGTVSSTLRPMGKITVDGEEETISACSKNGQFINEGLRVKITGVKMGDLLVETID